LLEGVIDDPTFLPVIYAAPEKADWRDEDVWRECNPALGDFRSLEEMREKAVRAEHAPAYQNTFRNLYLNQWTQQLSRWIDINVWDSQASIVDEPAMRGRKCYGGLDLSTVTDITAWAMVFPRDDDPDEIDVVMRFWCPEAKLHDPHNRYQDQYRLWKHQGWLQTTPGESIDYSFVKAQIIKDAQAFRIIDLNIDRLFQAHQLSGELQEEGLTVVGMGQGFMSMAAPMAELERRLLARKVHHGGNPLLRWMADNVTIKRDPAGNMKPDKAASQGRIDGIVALAMGLDRAMRHEEKEVVWVAV
jgi:phage terminase large subunit-like protein